MTNTTVTTRERNEATAETSIEIGKVGIGVIGLTSALIGSWAVICLVSATISSGGPVSLAASYFSALAG